MTAPNKRILIIEDSLIFQKMLETRLQSHGFETMIEADGLKGLNRVKKEKPDLVILDLMLPGMDGHKVCHMIKHQKDLKDIPVIMYTSRDVEKDETLAKQSGADAFIIKSIRPEVMINIVKELIAEKQTANAT